MKQLTEKKIVLTLIAACVFLALFGNSIRKIRQAEKAAEMSAPADVSRQASTEKVIYTCRLGDEEIPAVQIAEVTNGQTTGIVARVSAGAGIEVAAPGAAAVWDYKALSAHAGDNLIEIVHAPGKELKDYEWILTLADENTFFRERVRDCTEVSDE